MTGGLGREDGRADHHHLLLPRQDHRESRHVRVLLHKEGVLGEAPAHKKRRNLVPCSVHLLDDV